VSEATRIHGGIDAAELQRLGIDPARVLDLSVNVNPWGPHPRVLEAIRRASVASYPDVLASAARHAIAHAEDLAPDNVLIGHGSAELLWAAVSLLRGRDRPLLTPMPTFSEPQLAARAWGVHVISLRTHASEQFALSDAVLDRALSEHDAGAVYLCQPNNPDGGALPAGALRALSDAHPRRWFIVDQAFLSLSSRHSDAALRFGDNVLLVRSLTKDHGLPGLRAAYALGAPPLLAAVAAQRPSWMVSAPAEAAIVAACGEREHVAKARDYLLDARATLARDCERLGLSVVPSFTHFFLVHVAQDADQLRQRLLERHGVLVRSGRSFGLPEHIRVAGCAPEQRARFLAALQQELQT
jgi:histidinol-phosphate/aromatic aminotransferase/cobyric acid decarboxylase-like protein